MTITYRQLWRADPAAWQRAAVAWRRQQPVLARHGDRAATTVDDLRQAWSGTAADAATGQLAGLHERLAAASPALFTVDQILSGYAEQLGRAKSVLATWVGVAGELGLSVDRAGQVRADPAVTRPDGPTLAGARRVAAGIEQALAIATTADTDAARRLDDAATAASQGWPERRPTDRPAPGAGPAAVRSWWDGLDQAEQRWLSRHEPGWVGRLDGLPATARDQANRLLLARQRAALLAERARLLTTDAYSATLVPQLRRLDQLLAGLDTVADRLAAGTGPRAYLLALDTGTENGAAGRVVVALGDPDRADNVLTHVPGMGSGLDRAVGELDRAQRVQQRCHTLAPQESTAAVLWLDYTAPAFVDEAASAQLAHRGAADLHQFQAGLRAAGQGAPAELTVLGHSYGSLVVGTAAHEPGFAADNVVFVGSPGVGVTRADDLAVPAGQVWASTAPDDAIRLTGLPRWPPGEQLWFGPDPSDPAFGARVFTSDASGHAGYWAADNPALDSMARIVLGTGHQATVR
ncbi:alpha/beta hydrolase [Solwaraspora sp. WMMB335]|uniref:alpha/beta hydrolase n=1 Tax=Solwaraspora sp. WMMB335 TaxID=3404118 RepID=UPI003B93930E